MAAHRALPLTGRTALITGGSRGVGAASALALGALGADVVITYRHDATAASAVVDQLRAAGAHASAVLADLAADQPGQDIVTASRAVHQEYDIVVVNAPAPFSRVPLAQLDPDDLGEKARIDTASLHRICLAFVPGMRQRRFGRVIVISSGSSWGPTAPGLAAHGVSKAAMEAYVRYAATELAGEGVTINALQLGMVVTDGSSSVPEQARKILTAATPGGRIAEPADIGKVVALLADPASEWISGAAIPVTGGMNYPLNLSAVLSAGR
ncbi:SDR family oxidoreductase [Goodfellowiella coeruleoviolacea]|uniref:3-oxoacyl-[acyl-carrier protein] reductase n=1 Tax=Goodfellowiella coeruleoviolacea TaxID=334858 RepID=A0AAE3GHL3_9PSEU|nr:SDR family oxidoreductase [Goodfellowiella coeruleoviolacea]MCP2167517.1 3-oxoacyl-[acyl-carrier protein] reductase [Goodfellowiella coeruleoviolacea]